MRTSDIAQIYPSTIERTDEMYLPTVMGKPIPVEQLTMDELRRGLCQRSGGRVDACRNCAAGCRWGREMVRKLECGSA